MGDGQSLQCTIHRQGIRSPNQGMRVGQIEIANKEAIGEEGGTDAQVGFATDDRGTCKISFVLNLHHVY